MKRLKRFGLWWLDYGSVGLSAAIGTWDFYEAAVMRPAGTFWFWFDIGFGCFFYTMAPMQVRLGRKRRYWAARAAESRARYEALVAGDADFSRYLELLGYDPSVSNDAARWSPKLLDDDDTQR